MTDSLLGQLKTEKVMLEDECLRAKNVIEKQKEANRILKSSEDNFNLLVNSISDYAIFMLDTKGSVVSWNSGAEQFIGYREAEVLGKNFSIFYAKDDLDSGVPEYELKMATQTGRCEIEGWRVRRDGTKFWGKGVITPLLDSDHTLTGFAKVMRDLTERKKSEDFLRMANELLEKRVADRTAELRDAIQTRDEFLSILSHELKTPLTSLSLTLQMITRSMNQFIKQSYSSYD